MGENRFTEFFQASKFMKFLVFELTVEMQFVIIISFLSVILIFLGVFPVVRLGLFGYLRTEHMAFLLNNIINIT